MVRKCLLAASLALLAIGVGRPAAADPKFLEEYGDIFGARTLLQTAEDTRPQSALMSPYYEGRNHLLVVSPFYRHWDMGGSADANIFGGGIAWAQGTRSQNPWEVNLNFFDTNVNLDRDSHFKKSSRSDDFNSFGWEAVGKFTIWGGYKDEYAYTGPVVTLVGRYREMQDLANRFDILVAADQRVTRSLYVTGNLGYGRLSPDVGDNADDVILGFGLTWVPAPRVSISGNYVVDNNVDGQDFFSLMAAYDVNDNLAAQLGFGKHGSIYANAFWRFGSSHPK
jgi:hypothetical protein